MCYFGKKKICVHKNVINVTLTYLLFNNFTDMHTISRHACGVAHVLPCLVCINKNLKKWYSLSGRAKPYQLPCKCCNGQLCWILNEASINMEMNAWNLKPTAVGLFLFYFGATGTKTWAVPAAMPIQPLSDWLTQILTLTNHHSLCMNLTNLTKGNECCPIRGRVGQVMPSPSQEKKTNSGVTGCEY